ncbi:MAG: hypothetical protein HRT61_04315 [Ekhidna sp.]|nr:hypothetical protein [Ekhidna sp.]
MKKWLKITLRSIASIVVILLVFGFAFYKRFIVNPPDHAFSDPQNLEESQLQDIEYLSKYPDYDRSFDTQAKLDSFYRHLDQLKAKLPVSEAAFEMEIAKALAYAENGHTNISAGARAHRLNSIPLRFYWFKEGLFTILAQDGYEELLGKRILKLNGRTPEELLTLLKPWRGGTDENLRAYSPLFLMSPEIMHAIGLGASSESFVLSVEGENGNTITQEVFASKEEKDIPGYWVPYWLLPEEKIKKSSWKSCKPAKTAAIPFQNMFQNVHHEFIGSTLYVQINDNYNTADRNLRNYLKGVTAEMMEKQPDKVVFDLRFNPGGNNYHLPWPFIRSINDYLNAGQKCWIITDHYTYSAGLITAAYANYTLGEKALIVGQKVGDRSQFWADGGVKMTLPNSRISPRIWTAYNDWENGCDDISKCFWFAYFDSVPAGSLEPDIAVPLSFYDYINGTDTVLDYILNN